MRRLPISNAQVLGLIAIALAGAVELGSQSTSASVVFAAIPSWGQDGQITGYVYGTNANQVSLYVYEFLPDLGWFQMSGCGAVPIDGTGQFSITSTVNLVDRTATRYSAFLVPSSLSAGCLNEAASIPFILTHNALASVTIPRLPQDPAISFGGLTWYVKSPPVPVYPGPQFYLNTNASVDSLGQLHLDLTQCSGSWCAAEIYSKDAVGYGTYSFTINSQVNNLDPNVTLGMFAWDGQAADQSNREWDIEFGRWGNANATANAQYVVQPYTLAGNINRFLMSPASPSTHTVTWLPNQMSFASVAGYGPAGPQIYQWNYPGQTPQIPTPGDVHLHINFYIAVGSAPTQPIGREIVLSGFQYTPLGSQVGFSRSGDSVPFQSESNSVPISGDSSCSGSVESDSPWLVAPASSVVGSNSLQYSVLENLGTPRTGNLILRSTNCTPTPGSQILTVTQAGLICNPAFAVNASNVGFNGGVRSVAVNGTAPVCSWSVASSSPWLQVVPPSSGTGDGQIQFSVQANANSGLRQGSLALSSGSQHSVYQDGSGSYLAISPLVASQCGSAAPQFSVSWIAPSNVEIRLNSPTGELVGQYGTSGSVALPAVSSGTLIFLTQLGSGGSVVLGSALATVVQSNCASPAISAGGVVNGASYSAVSVARGSLATVFGTNLSATVAQAATTSFPTSLGGASVSLSGEACPLSFASPNQINLLVPSDLQPGRYVLTSGTASADLIVSNASPGIFTVKGDGTGVPNATLIAALSDGSSVTLPIYQCGAAGCQGTPIQIPANASSLYVVLYATGIRNAQKVSATLGPAMASVLYAGPQAQFPGVDQINLQISQLAGLSGTQILQVMADGVGSNPVSLFFQ